MLISYKYKLIFLHNPKAAGVSVKRYMRDLHTEDTPQFAPHNPQLSLHWTMIKKTHVTVWEFVNRDGWCDYDKEIWESFYKFAIVRNPWDRLHSLWNWCAYLSDDEQNARFRERWPTFEAWLSDVLDNYRWRTPHFGTQNQFEYTHINGVQSVNKVLRFETLDEDWKDICKWMGVEYSPLPKKNTSTREKDYRQYYTDETAAAVAEIFAKDIELFGYEFG